MIEPWATLSLILLASLLLLFARRKMNTGYAVINQTRQAKPKSLYARTSHYAGDPKKGYKKSLEAMINLLDWKVLQHRGVPDEVRRLAQDLRARLNQLAAEKEVSGDNFTSAYWEYMRVVRMLESRRMV